MSRAEREKGARGEREVAAVLRAHNLPAVRTSNSGGLHVRGDLTGVPGYHFEVKRQETLRIQQWVRQAWDDCPPDGTVPVVVFRTNRVPLDNPLGLWHAVISLSELAKLLDLARLTA